MSRSQTEAMNHDAAWELLPWLVNGTLSGDEKNRVEAHVRGCLGCRQEMKAQHHLQSLVSESETVPQSSERALDELMQQVNAERRPGRFWRWLRRYWTDSRWMLAAACGLAALGVLLLVQPGLDLGRPDAAQYRTLSSPAAGGALVRITFADGITDRDRSAALAAFDARLVAGPTGDGSYLVRLPAADTSTREIDETIRRLASDARIRAAEPAQLAAEP